MPRVLANFSIITLAFVTSECRLCITPAPHVEDFVAGGPDDGGSGALLRNNDRVGRQPAPLGQGRERTLAETFAIRWIEEGQVAWRTPACGSEAGGIDGQ